MSRPLSVAMMQQRRFCWYCYRESVLRVAATMDRPMRLAFLAQARRHAVRGIPYPSPAEHARHEGARPVRSLTLVRNEEEQEGQ